MQTSEHLREVEGRIQEAASFIAPLKEEVDKVLVGQEGLLDTLLVGLITGGHVLVEGVPGLAKTLAVTTLAQAIGGSFSRLQFTPDLLPADLVGSTVYNAHEHTFTVNKGPIFANIVLADEINRAPAKVQSALLESMQERQATIGGQTIRLPHPFLVMATQNPIEQEGTYPLPEAQVDRFMLKTRVDYPDREEERQIMRRMAHPEVRLQIAAKASLQQILDARQWVDQVFLDPKIEEYILDLVMATRPRAGGATLSDRQKEANLTRVGELVEFGASPRATLALALGAKARAFIDGRAYVVPHDVKSMAPEVLRHRIIPTYEAEAEGMSTDHIVALILGQLRTP